MLDTQTGNTWRYEAFTIDLTNGMRAPMEGWRPIGTFQMTQNETEAQLEDMRRHVRDLKP